MARSVCTLGIATRVGSVAIADPVKEMTTTQPKPAPRPIERAAKVNTNVFRIGRVPHFAAAQIVDETLQVSLPTAKA